jgi:hypothetical protein
MIPLTQEDVTTFDDDMARHMEEMDKAAHDRLVFAHTPVPGFKTYLLMMQDPDHGLSLSDRLSFNAFDPEKMAPSDRLLASLRTHYSVLTYEFPGGMGAEFDCYIRFSDADASDPMTWVTLGTRFGTHISNIVEIGTMPLGTSGARYNKD